MGWFRTSQPQQSKASQPATATVAPPAPSSAPDSAPAVGIGATAATATAAPAPSLPRRPGESLHGAPGHGHGRSLPCIGYPEAYYLKHVKEADERGDAIAHDCYKVGQYVTLGLDHKEPPERKAKYFGHALRRHAQPPSNADAHLRDFYHRLSELIRKSAGTEIVRMAKRENEILQKRLSGGANREQLAGEFNEFLKKATADSAHHCPDWIDHEHWDQLRAIRSQWS